MNLDKKATESVAHAMLELLIERQALTATEPLAARLQATALEYDRIARMNRKFYECEDSPNFRNRDTRQRGEQARLLALGLSIAVAAIQGDQEALELNIAQATGLLADPDYWLEPFGSEE